MTEVTQGTLISGVRFDKYENIPCYGVIINARCDLAQNKTNKVYYLAVIPLSLWIQSSEGFFQLTQNKLQEVESKIKAHVNPRGLAWETLKTFEINEFDKVIKENFNKDKDIKILTEDFINYKKFSSTNETTIENTKLLNTITEKIIKFFEDVSNGKNRNLLLIPKEALVQKSFTEPLIVDVSELDFVNIFTVNQIAQGEMDVKNIKLSEPTKSMYNKKFFLMNDPGYSIICDEIISPWVEYIVQHFANAFIRVGVDNMTKESIKVVVNQTFEMESFI